MLRTTLVLCLLSFGICYHLVAADLDEIIDSVLGSSTSIDNTVVDAEPAPKESAVFQYSSI